MPGDDTKHIDWKVYGRTDRYYIKPPWIAWGPYLWADGVNGRSDGLVYTREDLESDGTHPSTSGRKKVAELLLDFFKRDSTAQGWFVKKQKVSQNRIHN